MIIDWVTGAGIESHRYYSGFYAQNWTSGTVSVGTPVAGPTIATLADDGLNSATLSDTGINSSALADDGLNKVTIG